MLFNSATFAIFLAIVLGIYYLPLSWRAKKFHLLISSYIFYAAWNPPFVILVWLSTVVDWFAAKKMARTERNSMRRLLLLGSLATNLGLLGFFKYGDFLVEAFATLVAYAGIHYQAPAMGIILPVGISFYTFQTLSYTIDVYRRELEPADSFLDFALFVTFFPQLVAGPIVRASQFLPQLLQPVRANAREFGWGMSLLTIGLFQKVVLADAFLAPVADTVFTETARAGVLEAWMGSLAFSAQVFFDFAGYSSCAIGVAICFGFALPDNFRSPFAAIGFVDLWRRWHISLSTWLRDYLYRSLRGRSRGKRRAAFALMATMLLGGLWHGAAWHFVAWGAIHGGFIMVERWLRKTVRGVSWVTTLPGQLLMALLTYSLWCLSAPFFRAAGMTDAIHMLRSMVGLGAGDSITLQAGTTAIVGSITVVMLAVHWWLRNSTIEDAWARRHHLVRAVMLAAMLVAIFISPGEDRAFVYFQF